MVVDSRQHNWCGAVLVGGLGRRFGGDKAGASFRGVPLFHHMLGILHTAGSRSLAYVGGAPRLAVPFHADHLPDREDPTAGPLRGILTVLDHCWGSEGKVKRPDCAVVLSCDIPLLSAASVKRLVETAAFHDAVVASAERDHWSCIALRPASHAILLAAHRGGIRSVRDALSELSLGRVTIDQRELTNANDAATLAAIIADDDGRHR